MSRLILKLLIGVVGINLSFADDVVKNKQASIASNKSVEFNIAKDSPLTAKLVDYAWANREDLNNQQIIADYLKSQYYSKKPIIPKDYETAWKVSRLVYFIGNYGLGEKKFIADNRQAKSDGSQLFNYGVSAGLAAMAINPKGVEGHYWYAVNLGSYGLVEGVLASARKAKDGIAALKTAISIDPSYQNYGSNRILGRYYQELPKLFGGDKDKALQLFQEATEKAPQYRNNWVFLGQYYLKTSNYVTAKSYCEKALDLPSQDGLYEEKRFTREANECVSSTKSKIK